MEEWVGQKWHHFITQKSTYHYPEFAVALTDIKKQLGIFFRTLGGDAGVTLGHTSAQPNNSHRNWLQKISGTGKKSEQSHFSRDHYYLPEKLDCFPSRQLNEDLYYWLAAMGSFNRSPKASKAINHNHLLTQTVLLNWPGLAAVYRRLAPAHLKQRPQIDALPKDAQVAEKMIQRILSDPMTEINTDNEPGLLTQPVVLWLKAVSNSEIKALKKQPSKPQNAQSRAAKQNQSIKRYHAEEVDQKESKDGFMSFRLESMFSWSEFINVDRSEDDGDDEDVMRVADDLDQLSVNQGETSNKIRLDLDLPGRDYDDTLLKGGILLPEWDHKKGLYLADHCSLSLMQLRLDQAAIWPAELKQQAQQLKRQFESLKPVSTWHNRQPDGDELDLNAYLEFKASFGQQKQLSEPMLYRQLIRHRRDLSTSVLTDLSLSTDAHVNDDKKVIDVIRESLYLLAESLHSAGEHFSLAGFTSKNRNHVRYYNIKHFSEPFNQACRDQIHAIKPAYYTRMGTAIRYATQQLLEQPSEQKLLLILTDGKPNDLDKYEGRYGLEDTRKAITEAKNQGLTPFCVSIDYQASDYLPYLFGSQGFIHLNNALDLPKKLPKLFFQLVH